MRVFLLLCLCTFIAGTLAAPQRHNLQTGTNDNENKPYIEEVVVESVLQVRTPSGGRTSRTNTQVNLQDGSRVAEMKRS